MVTSNAQMEAMRMLILAKKSAIRNDQKAFLSSFVMRTVAYACLRPALLKLNLCVTMAKTWQTIFVMESVTLNSQQVKTHIVGLAIYMSFFSKVLQPPKYTLEAKFSKVRHLRDVFTINTPTLHVGLRRGLLTSKGAAAPLISVVAPFISINLDCYTPLLSQSRQ